MLILLLYSEYIKKSSSSIYSYYFDFAILFILEKLFVKHHILQLTGFVMPITFYFTRLVLLKRIYFEESIFNLKLLWFWVHVIITLPYNN